MKKYKVLIFALVVTIFSCNAQTNQLSIQEFSNIKINNVLLSEIQNTKGVENTIKSLFGNDLSVLRGEEPSYWVKFTSPSFKIIFRDGQNFETGAINDYQLTSLLVKNSNISVSIKGVDFRLGDNISVLPNSPQFLTYSDGRKEIVYKLGVQVIEIGYNLNTGIINKIKYVCYTT